MSKNSHVPARKATDDTKGKSASEITHIPEQSFTVIIKEYDSDYSIDYAIEDNVNVLKQCQVYNLPYVLIDTEYDVDISLP